MARSVDHNVGKIYQTMRGFVRRCLIGDGAVLPYEAGSLWTLGNLDEVWTRFSGPGAITANEDEDKKSLSFDDKLRIQFLENPQHRRLSASYAKQSRASEPVRRLMSEIILVHLLILWKGATGTSRKRESVEMLEALKLDDAEALFKTGVLHPGRGYVKDYRELHWLIHVGRRFKDAAFKSRVAWPENESGREDVVAAIGRIDEEIRSGTSDTDRELKNVTRARHSLWHMCYPDWFERCVSYNHRRQIRSAFAALLPAISGQSEIDIDEDLYAIRERVEKLPGAEKFKWKGGGEHDVGERQVIDFYHSQLRRLWDADASLLLPTVRLKKQVVLYGPPGTGKSHAARRLATSLLLDHHRRELSTDGRADLGIAAVLEHGEELEREWLGKGPAGGQKQRIHRLQLHPALSYETFVGGRTLEANGAVKWKDGYVYELVAKMRRLPGPHVLILDELNRTDLSRLFGELLSALEDRGELFDIPGANEPLSLPPELYVIATMNEIDHSLEQVDFALRRRFAWHFTGFDGDTLQEELQRRFDGHARLKTLAEKLSPEARQADFSTLVERALELNKLIEDHERLGPRFAIGHAYFFSLVELLAEYPLDPNGQSFLYRRNEVNEPVAMLWRLAIKPLLESYVSGMERDERTSFLEKCERRFLRGMSAS